MESHKIILRPEQIALIEELAQVNESAGTPPAMSKIVGLLMVADELELTFDQIKDTLDLSKSAVSQALTQLLMSKKISYKTKIGDRKRYFHIKVIDWEDKILEHFDGMSSLLAVFKKVQQVRTPNTPEFNKHLETLTEFMSLLHNQVVTFYQTYKAGKK